MTNQYGVDGVLFSGTPGPVISDDSANPTSPVLSPGPGYSGTIDATFISPVAAVSFDIGYMDSLGGATVSWYSKTGRLLGEKSTDQLGITTIVLDGSSISRVHIDTTTDPAGAGIDNFQFTPR